MPPARIACTSALVRAAVEVQHEAFDTEGPARLLRWARTYAARQYELESLGLVFGARRTLALRVETSVEEQAMAIHAEAPPALVVFILFAPHVAWTEVDARSRRMQAAARTATGVRRI